MFQLFAILAFFILGLAFFAIGKDDFGIKRIKPDSNNNTPQAKGPKSPEIGLSNESNIVMENISNEIQSDSKETSKISE